MVYSATSINQTGAFSLTIFVKKKKNGRICNNWKKLRSSMSISDEIKVMTNAIN